jgi:hypothetical protein
MRRFPLSAVLFSLTVVLALPARLAAEPLQITGGYLLLSGVQDIMSRGFMRTIAYDLQTESFSFAWTDSDFVTQRPLSPVFQRPTNITFAGDAAATFGFVDSVSDLTIVATPSLTPTPFSFSARFRLVDESRTVVFFDDVLFGSGMASWRWALGTANISEVRYEFSDAAPTPEPATLFLLGSGVVGLVMRRRMQG